MNAHVQAQINAAKAASVAPAASSRPAKGKTSAALPAPRSAAQNTKEAEARQQVVGVGRLAWTNTTFGIPLPCRKYLLADEGQARQLDELFYRVTGTQPT